MASDPLVGNDTTRFPINNHLFVIALIGFLISTPEGQNISIDHQFCEKEICRKWLRDWLDRQTPPVVLRDTKPLKDTSFLKVLITNVENMQVQAQVERIDSANLPPRDVLVKGTQEALAPVQAAQTAATKNLDTKAIPDLAKMSVSQQLLWIARIKQINERVAQQLKAQTPEKQIFATPSTPQGENLQRLAQQQAADAIIQTMAKIDPNTPITPILAQAIGQKIIIENPLLSASGVNPHQLRENILELYGSPTAQSQAERKDLVRGIREQQAFSRQTAPTTDQIHANLAAATHLSQEQTVDVLAQVEMRLAQGKGTREALAEVLMQYPGLPNQNILPVIEHLNPLLKSYLAAMPIVRAANAYGVIIPKEIIEATIRYNAVNLANNRPLVSLSTVYLRSQGFHSGNLRQLIPGNDPIAQQRIFAPLNQLENDRRMIFYAHIIFNRQPTPELQQRIILGSPNPLINPEGLIEAHRIVQYAGQISPIRVRASHWLLQKFGSWTTQEGGKKLIGQLATWTAGKLATDGLTKLTAHGVGILAGGVVTAFGLPGLAPFVEKVVSFVTETGINFVRNNLKKIAGAATGLTGLFAYSLFKFLNFLPPGVFGVASTGVGILVMPLPFGPILSLPLFGLGAWDAGRFISANAGKIGGFLNGAGSKLASFLSAGPNALLPSYLSIVPLAAFGAVAATSLISVMALASAFVLPPIQEEGISSLPTANLVNFTSNQPASKIADTIARAGLSSSLSLANFGSIMASLGNTISQSALNALQKSVNSFNTLQCVSFVLASLEEKDIHLQSQNAVAFMYNTQGCEVVTKPEVGDVAVWGPISGCPVQDPRLANNLCNSNSACCGHMAMVTNVLGNIKIYATGANANGSGSVDTREYSVTNVGRFLRCRP